MGLNPIALTYDWGMGTDLANRNIKRICGKLGVRNVTYISRYSPEKGEYKKKIFQPG